MVSGQKVNFSDNEKYLGVILDSKLNWNTHFNAQIAKCKAYLFSILLTHEGSHREVYGDFQPSLSSAGGAKD